MLWPTLHQLKSKNPAVRRKAVASLHQSPNERATRVLDDPDVAVAQAKDSFGNYQFHAQRVIWVFEHLRVYLCVRPDQICLALFLQNRPDLPLGLVETVLQEFGEFQIP